MKVTPKTTPKATPEEIAKVQEQLSQTCNDPNMWILECHCIDLSEKGDCKPDCKNCSAYQEFAKEHPNHLPKR